MTRAYQEIYLNKAQSVLGDAFDYAINTCGIAGNDFIKLFSASTVSGRMENGEPATLAGMSGSESFPKNKKNGSNVQKNTGSVGLLLTINGIRAENTAKSSGFSLMTTCCKCIIRFTKQTLQNSLMSLISEYANTTRKPI